MVDDIDVEKLRSSEGPLARPSRMEEEIISGHYPPGKTSTPNAQVSMDDCSTCVEGQAEALSKPIAKNRVVRGHMPDI